ncbi:hypothetical protein ES703_91771 [subsurface metagenome]
MIIAAGRVDQRVRTGDEVTHGSQVGIFGVFDLRVIIQNTAEEGIVQHNVVVTILVPVNDRVTSRRGIVVHKQVVDGLIGNNRSILATRAEIQDSVIRAYITDEGAVSDGNGIPIKTEETGILPVDVVVKDAIGYYDISIVILVHK